VSKSTRVSRLTPRPTRCWTTAEPSPDAEDKDVRGQQLVLDLLPRAIREVKPSKKARLLKYRSPLPVGEHRLRGGGVLEPAQIVQSGQCSLDLVRGDRRLPVGECGHQPVHVRLPSASSWSSAWVWPSSSVSSTRCRGSMLTTSRPSLAKQCNDFSRGVNHSVLPLRVDSGGGSPRLRRTTTAQDIGAAAVRIRVDPRGRDVLDLLDLDRHYLYLPSARVGLRGRKARLQR